MNSSLIRPSCALIVAMALLVPHLFITAPAFAQIAQEEVFEAPVSNADYVNHAMRILIGSQEERQEALNFIVERGKTDMVPTLALLMNIGGSHIDVASALEKLTGQRLSTWREALLYQEAHPEIVPHSSYRDLKLRYFTSIDQRFMEFFDPKYSNRDKMKIRFEEIMWGGARVDSIPALDNPALVSATDANYLNDDDLVFGVSINSDARAYPLRIMGWHEMFNDVIGGVPVALAYCTLCGSGILFETMVEGKAEPLIFGSSGLLYRSNKLMFDRKTKSLWNQFTGKPVSGPLVDENIKLKIRPVTITSWKAWRAGNPETRVLSIETGHFRDYGSGVVYRDYFASPNLMFPTIVRDETVLKRKNYVFGIRDFGAARAWPLAAFKKTRVINDKIGSKPLVLIGDALTRTVRAYERGEHEFENGLSGSQIKSKAGVWQVSEEALIGPDGTRLSRLPGHISYWFAWDGYLGTKSSLYQPPT